LCWRHILWFWSSSDWFSTLNMCGPHTQEKATNEPLFSKTICHGRKKFLHSTSKQGGLAY
jgi:hypothetical protein